MRRARACTSAVPAHAKSCSPVCMAVLGQRPCGRGGQAGARGGGTDPSRDPGRCAATTGIVPPALMAEPCTRQARWQRRVPGRALTKPQHRHLVATAATAWPALPPPGACMHNSLGRRAPNPEPVTPGLTLLAVQLYASKRQPHRSHGCSAHLFKAFETLMLSGFRSLGVPCREGGFLVLGTAIS